MANLSAKGVSGASRYVRDPGEAWLEENVARARKVGRFADFFDIDVARAKALLARNPENRVLVAAGVREWSESLRRCDWQINGEPIIVADTGEVNDGQHRLTAVVETGITMHTLVVFGVSRESRKTVDSGKKRTPGHVLAMSGMSQATLVAATLKALLNLTDDVSVGTHRTTPEIERAIDRFPNVHASLGRGAKVNRQLRVATGLCCALHYLMAQRDQRGADNFFDMLADGTAPTKNHPAAQLRKRLTDNLANKAKLPLLDIAAIFIKAWNAFRIGKTVTNLRWRTEGDRAEPFPKVQ